MRIIVDTSVLSGIFRRRAGAENPELTLTLNTLVRYEDVVVIGPVRQEFLTGIREFAQFRALRERLSVFSGANPVTEDFETAAAMSNTCRTAGVQGSGTDLLICAMAARLDVPIFTTDKDFEHYAKHLHIRLYAA